MAILICCELTTESHTATSEWWISNISTPDISEVANRINSNYPFIGGMAFRTKLFLIVLTTVGVTCGFLFWLNLQSASKMSFRLIQEKVLAIAVSAAPHVDGDLHETLISSDQNNSPEYRTIRDRLREIRDANQSGDLNVTFIYTIRPTANPGEYIFVVDAEEEGEDKSQIGDEVEYNDGAEVPELDSAHVDSTLAEDSYGKWLTAYAPIKNSTGDHVALLGVDIEADAVLGQIKSIQQKGWLALACALAIAAVVAHFLCRLVSAPLEKLETHIHKVRDGDLSARIEFDTDDEFGRVGNSLNKMTAGLQEREALKGALVRYVSSQAVDSVIESDLEAESQRKVTVLIAALIGTKGITRSIPPDRIFSLLNDWFSTTIDVVLGHRGTIEQSEGEAVSALFGVPLRDPGQERNAVEAALAMMREIKRLRKTWQINSDIPLSLKIAIHTGTTSVTQFDAGNQQIDSQSLAKIEEITSSILSACGDNEGIFVSGRTNSGLRGTIPFGESEMISTSIGELEIMPVEMPI